ncbi:PadR family transcriptional regulator [Arthrobacter halodurans]|uniref:PadR family transcriptional regulator n=1 Tax=Arthrobacter halodurans TaxID=516699 RepID=A0ABV4UK32_9MICC
MASVFAHGAMRLYLLRVLEEGPRHGYDIIKALEDRFGGTYSPSAGSVYPRLAKLGEEGLVATERIGRRTVYSLTEAGAQEVAGRRDELEGIDDDISASVARLAETLGSEIRDNMRGLRADLAATAERLGGTAARRGPRTRPVGGGPGHDAAPPAAAGGGPPDPSDDAARPPRVGAPRVPADTGPRVDGPRELLELEHQLDDFRAQLRLDLRIAAAGGSVPASAPATVKAVLDQARSSIRAALR